jgi:tetratricopeptide (TPR) repeat protein
MKHYIIFISLLFILLSFSCINNNKTENKNVSVTKTDSIYDNTEMNTAQVSEQIITELNKKINKAPKNANLYNERSKLFINKGQINNALKDIKKALEIDSTNALFYCTLSDIYFEMGKIQNCIGSLKKAISLNNSHRINIDVLLKLAKLELYQKEYFKALEYINGALNTDMLNPRAYFLKGFTYKEMGDTAKAISNLQTAVEQNPEYYDAYMQLGLLFSAKKDKLSEAYFKNALKIKPVSIEALYALGMFYQEDEPPQIDKAVETYSKIIETDPDNKKAHYNIGYLNLVFLKHYYEAINNFTNAIQNDSNYFQAYYNRGYCYELLKDYENAKTDYKKALKIKVNFPKAIQGLNRVDK